MLFEGLHWSWLWLSWRSKTDISHLDEVVESRGLVDHVEVVSLSYQLLDLSFEPNGCIKVLLANCQM